LDLGSAPGGWSQVIAEKVGQGNVLAVDLSEMLPIEGVKFIRKNFLDDDTKDVIMSHLKKVDVITNDMAPNTSGDKKIDHIRIIELAKQALSVAIDILENNGSFISKIFQGNGEKEFISELRKYFGKVNYFKPKSSRKDSPETYIVAQQFNLFPPNGQYSMQTRQENRF
jgi:23S rRNA (uridine2552-2'-O)-methyltransferase